MSETSPVTEPVQPAAEPQPRLVSREAEHHHGGILDTVQWLAGTVTIAIFVITFVLQAFQIPSPSMENTLLVGDYLLVDKVHYANSGIWGKVEPYSPIRNGDIIVFRYPINPSEHFVKRVVGVPGDRIRLINKRVYVNGRLMIEPYAIHRSTIPDEYRDQFPNGRIPTSDVERRWWNYLAAHVVNGELLVPPGHFFVLGDNRDDSDDSRYWGFVPRENIIGRPLVIYWSLRDTDHIDGMPAAQESPDGKLFHFFYSVAHVFQLTRWDRTLRLVH